MTKRMLLALALCLLTLTATAHAFNEMPIPKDIYEWVQSSARINYYFNRQHLSYAVSAEGRIDLTRLKVPVVKSYDALQAEDVLQKRRWRDQRVDGFEDLSGEANYLTIDLANAVVYVNAVELLDSHMWTLERATPERVVDLKRLSAKSREAIFYAAILEYERAHRLEIVAQTKGELTKEDRKLLDALKKSAEKSDREKNRKSRKKRKRQEEHSAESVGLDDR